MDYLHIELDKASLNNISNLGLAHVGDGVYELMVRSWLILHGKLTNQSLHQATVERVSAQAQAARSAKLQPLLTEEEQAVYRRGRNSNPHTISKAASRGEYQTATALETLFGWLYLQGKTTRLNELFDIMMEDASPCL